MNHLKRLCAVLLVLLLLLSGCAKDRSVADAKGAEDALIEFLGEFGSYDEDAYHCTLQDTLTKEGQSVYLFEAFWNTEDGEAHSLGLFRVSADGTVSPQEAPADPT